MSAVQPKALRIAAASAAGGLTVGLALAYLAGDFSAPIQINRLWSLPLEFMSLGGALGYRFARDNKADAA